MTRGSGVVDSARGLIPFGHLGWGYRDRGEFLARAAEYIADGLAQNQRVEYVGAASRDRLRAELAALPALPTAADLANVQTAPVTDFYSMRAGSDVVDPETAVATRVAAVEKAIAEGYTGFRAIVDCTSIAQRPDQRDAFARFEFLIDQTMAVLPVSALCAYDISELADEADALVCLHPYVDPGAPSFRVYAARGADFALSGEVDTANSATFITVLQRIWPLTAGPEVIIDAVRLTFIAHRELLALDQFARERGSQVLLRGRQPLLSRLTALLELTNVRLETTGD